MVSFFSHFLRPAAAAAAATLLLVSTGCSQPTPEERLLKARQAWSQQDPLGAEIELQKLVEKYPDDPAAIEARMILASIYARDERLDEALAECKAALEKVSINSDRGMGLLRQYMEILKARKRHADGYAKLDEYEKEFGSDKNVMGSLRFARADLLTNEGKTTAARETLSAYAATTTDTQVLSLVRRMSAQTYLMDKNTTGAIERVREDYDKATSQKDKIGLIYELASLYFIADDYPALRSVLVEGAKLTDEAITSELDRNMRVQMAAETARLYQQVGNLDGARQIHEAILQSATIPVMIRVAQELATVYIREGRTSDAINVFRDTGKKLADVPNSPSQAFLNQADMIQNLLTSNKLPPMDITTMTLRFRADAPLGLASIELLRAKEGQTTAPVELPAAISTSPADMTTSAP